MKMLAMADRYGLPRPVAHQVYYSLVARDFEWELMPLGLDQKVGTLVWSPLSGAKLSGKVGRTKTPPEGSRAATDASWDVPEERLYAVTDVLEALSADTGHSVPRLALAWLLTRPTVSSVVIGARHADQLRDNLGATEVRLTPEQLARLDEASTERPVYPYWHQRRTPWTGTRHPSDATAPYRAAQRPRLTRSPEPSGSLRQECRSDETLSGPSRNTPENRGE
jgi:aryl-alcohol dehydrogenase-like predicted oxidoreductase